MKSFGDCLKKNGLGEYEKAILTAKKDALVGEGYEARNAAVMAVTAYRDDLLERRAAIYKEIGVEGPVGAAPAAATPAAAPAAAKPATKAKKQEAAEPPKKEKKAKEPTPEQIAAKEAKAAERKAKAKAAREAARGEGLTNNVNLKKQFQKIGIDIRERSDITGEKGKGANKTGAMVGTFRIGGKPADYWGMKLVDDGWLRVESQNERGNENMRASTDDVHAFMRRVFDGQEIYKIDNDARFDALAQSVDGELTPLEVADLVDSGLTTDQNAEAFDAAMFLAEAGLTPEQTEAILERASIQSDEKSYEQAVRDGAAEASRGDEARPGGPAEEAFGLESQTNAEAVAAEEKAAAAAAKKAREDAKPTGPTVKADQVDIFNTQGGLFQNGTRASAAAAPEAETYKQPVRQPGESFREYEAKGWVVDAMNGKITVDALIDKLRGTDLPSGVRLAITERLGDRMSAEQQRRLIAKKPITPQVEALVVETPKVEAKVAPQFLRAEYVKLLDDQRWAKQIDVSIKPEIAKAKEIFDGRKPTKKDVLWFFERAKKFEDMALRPSKIAEASKEVAASLRAIAEAIKAEIARPAEPMLSLGYNSPAARAIAAFKRWFGSSKVVDAQGNPLRVYHGSQRPDRIGTVFRRSRATSGPMSFFTDDPGIASNYAKGKADTSKMREDSNYPAWFKMRVGRTKANIDRAWYFLTSEQRAKIAELAPRVSQDNEGQGTLVLDPEGHKTGLGGYDQHIKEAKGNHLGALVEEWLNSGSLFNSEEEFMDVLRMAGMPMQDVEMDFPDAAYPAVFPVYLSIQNPLNTAAIPDAVVAALERAANRQRRHRPDLATDTWDKNNRPAREWVAELKDDVAKGTSHSWTSIPDWVTKTLRSLGYDGIQDVGGKFHPDKHAVWIPFEETQVKSAISNIGTWSPDKKDYRLAIKTGQATGASLPKAQIERFVAALRKQWKNAPNIVVVDRVADLPREVPDRTHGMYYDGVVYLVAENLSSNDVMQWTLLHETLGHFGLQGVLGDALESTMERIYQTNSVVRKEADRRIAFYKENGHDLSIAKGVEEALSDMAADGRWSQISGWQMLFAQIRNALRKLGFTLNISNADVAILLANARRYVREGPQEQVAGEAQPALSLGAILPWQDRFYIREKDGVFRVASNKNLNPISPAFKTEAEAEKWAAEFYAQTTPNNPDVRLSLGPMFTMAQDGPVGAIKQQLLDRFRFEGKSMSWINKSINTPFHVAETNKWFRPIYQGVQRFITDVSSFANDAAEVAGEQILPRLQNWNDVAFNPFSFSNWTPEARAQRGPALRRDLRAAGKVIWAGTLSDTRPTEQQLRDGFEASVRDTNGNEIGTVKSPPLTEAQIGYYQRMRRTIDLSIDQGIVSEMVKATKDNKREKQLKSLDDARKMAKDDPISGVDEDGLPNSGPLVLLYALDKRTQEIIDKWARGELPDNDARKLIESTQAKIEIIREKQAVAEKLKDEGYAPLMRFGQYTVEIAENTSNATGGTDTNVLYFGMFETKKDANRMARDMLAEYKTTNPLAEVKLGTMDTESWKVMRGLSLDTLEAFAKATGINEKEAVQNYIKMAVASRSALKRLIHRKGIAGYDEDVQRVLATFVTSQARFAARNYHYGELTQFVNKIPKEHGETAGYATRLLEYVQFPNEEAQAVRGFLFTQFIGGSIASALVNISQPALTTVPYLSQFEPARGFAGIAKSAGMAAASVTKALAIVAKGTSNGILKQAMDLAAKEGITEPQEIHQLHAESIRSGLAGRSLYARKMLRAWAAAFSLAESFNRKVTFVAAFEMARSVGMDSINAVRREQGKEELANAYEFAANAIAETQFTYNKGNRPNISRGPIGATVMTFKQFAISYVEFLSRLPKRERVLALAILVIAAGVEGLPFSEDLMDLWDTIWQALGYNANAKKNMRANVQAFATKAIGETAGGYLSEFVLGGISGIPGSPVDISGRLGFGNLIPGTAIFKRSTTDATREVAQAMGPLGSVVISARQGLAALEAGQARTALYNVVPKAIRDAMQAMDMAQAGYYRDLKGKRVIETDLADAAFKFIGLMPYDVLHEGRRTQGISQDIALHNVVEASIADRWAKGIVDKDPEAVEDAVKELFAWNLRNPELRIVINPQQIRQRVQSSLMTGQQRLMRRTPREIREFAP